jgi:putative ABC transport system permease protein
MSETPHPRGTDGLGDSANRSLRTVAAAMLKVAPGEVVEAQRPEDIDSWSPNLASGQGGAGRPAHPTSVAVHRSGPWRVLTRVTRRGMAESWAARVLAVIALAVAAGFALATTVALGSVERGLGSGSLDTANGADLVVRGRVTTSTPLEVVRSGVDAGMSDLLGQIDGVTWVDSRISGPVVIRLGNDPAIAGGLLAGTTFATWSDRLDVGLAKGSAPTESGQVVVSSRTASELGAKIGDVIAVGGAGELRLLEVVGVADSGAALGRTLLGTADDIQRVLGRFDQFDAFFVAVDDPADPGAVSVAGPEVVTLAEHQESRPQERAVAAKPVRTVLRIVTVVVLVGVLVALYAMLRQVVATRRRDYALLRALGASRNNLRGAVVADALWTSVAAGLLAPFVALGLLPLLGDTLGRLGLPRLQVGAAELIGYLPWALLIALGAALLASIPLARHVARTSPVDALTDRPIGKPVGSAATPARPSQRSGRASSRLGVPARIARRELSASRRRLLPVVVALGALFGLVVAVVVVTHGVRQEASADVSELAQADYVVDSGVITTGGFGPEVVDIVEAVPGVHSASAVRSAGATIDAYGGRVLGVDLDQVGGHVALEPTEGTLPRTSSEMLLSVDVASSLERGVGDTVWVALAGGQARQLEVVGLVRSGPLVASGVVDRSVFLEDLPASADLFVLFDADETGPADVGGATARRVQAAVDGDVGFGTVVVADRLIEGRSSMFDDLEAVLLVVTGVAVATALVGLASTMFVAAVSRRREMALLWTAGADRGQRATVAGWQAAAVALTATAMGCILGWLAGSFVVSMVFGGWPSTDIVGLLVVALAFATVTMAVAALSALVVDRSAVRRALQLV